MTDLTKTTVKRRSELAKDIELKITTSRQNVNKIKNYSKAYREEVKAVIKTITEEGNYWKKLIDKKVDNLVELVQDEEQKALHNMSALTKVYRGVFENCQQWQKNIKGLETVADVLLLQKVKKLKVSVDNIDLKQVQERSSVSYRMKKHSHTEIDSLFGELQFRDITAVIANTDNQQITRSQKSQKRYKYTCEYCGTLQVSTKKPDPWEYQNDPDPWEYRQQPDPWEYHPGLMMVCKKSTCRGSRKPSWHNMICDS